MSNSQIKALLPLPPGYEPLEELRARAGARLVHARRGGDEVLLRMERATGGESAAELAVLAAVRHPGLARLVDHGALPATAHAPAGRFVARRWIEGAELTSWSEGRTEEELGRVVADVADALDHLHRAGFVHGDLKPENVLVDGDGAAVLTDYGLSRQRDAAHGPDIAGTLYAIAPEVLLGAAPSPSSDLFALGAMLHRLLVGERANASEFYARFPGRSFFDAAETPPERLPSWARDVVAAMVAREPARRPDSAGAVARTLRARLGVPYDASRAGEVLRFPSDLGRERWMNTLHARVVEPRVPGEGPDHVWVRVPDGEAASEFAASMRLFGSLRGTASVGIDLDEVAARLADPMALDRWARRTARDASGLVVLSVDDTTPWAERAVELFVRALRQQAREGEVRLVAVAHAAPPESVAASFEPHALPPVSAERIDAFLAQHLPGETPERRAEFARLLLAVSGGAATRLDQAMRRAAGDGWILPQDEEGWRLKPGPIATASNLAPSFRAPSGSVSLSDEALDVLGALHIAGGRLAGSEIDALGLSAGTTGVPALIDRRIAAWELTPRGRELVLAALADDVSPLGVERLKRLHLLRAEQVEATGRDRWRALAHRFASGADVGQAVVHEMERLARGGGAELALALGEHATRFAREMGRDVGAELPRLALEESRAWSALGRLDLAEEAVARIAARPETAALAMLGRARVASERRAAEDALAWCDRAAEADPLLALEVRATRIQILHELGRDQETIDEVSAIGSAGTPRQTAFLRSLAAVSLFRLGRIPEAREQLDRLVGEASRLGDVVLEGALRIDLGTIARRTGDMERAITELKRAALCYEEVGHIAGLAHARSTLGGVLRDRGEMAAAEPLLATAMSMRERLGDERGANTVRGTFGLLLAERGHAHPALEELERSAGRMDGAQRLRFRPLLLAKADEVRARIGLPADAERGDDDAPDPRVLVAHARAAWIRGDEARARSAAVRALELAQSLGLAPVAAEASAILCANDASAGDPIDAPAGSSAAEDRRLLLILDDWTGADGSLLDEAIELAESLSARGRDDRAARTWLAIAARAADGAQSVVAAERAESCFARAAAGLTEEQRDSLRNHLLGMPDPHPGDLVPRPSTTDDEEWDMEIVSLLEINHRLVEQGDLSSLLGEIVDAALSVTGAERGFLALAERGEVRFDTAHDSRRGDIAQPDFEVSTSILNEALERMEPMRLSNAVDDPLLGHTPSIVSLELRSILCVPFRVDAEVSGAIYVDHRLRTGAFDDKSERLCALLADQAALAIRQMRRVDEIRGLNQRLAAKVESQEEDLVAARRALEDAGVHVDHGLIGTSAVMQHVRTLIERAAKSGMVVLVTGESGTGKEIAARALHKESGRAEGPFVSENCAALPPTLIESELFGYRRGAFTGADSDREGLFERANGGTLFLDEIGEMPLALQAKLLRVLETGEVRRVGDTRSRSVDFRLVAATNRDLAHEIREARFREDLYYRLDGLRIEMPRLAKRTEDIPALVNHFLSVEEQKSGIPRRASAAVLEILMQRDWPGNVRELRNEVARLCVLSEGDLDDPGLVRAADPIHGGEPGQADDGPPPPLAELERRAILEALRFTNGDKRKTAELLGISRAKVYQRLKEWGV